MSSQIVSTYTFRQLEDVASGDRNPADVVARALAEADAIRERARAEGEQAGYAAGIERAQTETRTALSALAEAVGAVVCTRDELAETLTTQAGELAMLTAEHIIAGAIAAEPARIVDVVRGTLRRLTERHRVTVMVNPEDLEIVSAAVGTVKAELGGIEHLDVQADRRIARGGAVAQTVYGEIDASVGAQLQAARELVAAALAGDSQSEPHADDETDLVLGDGV